MKLEIDNLEELKQLAVMLTGGAAETFQQILTNQRSIMATQQELVVQLTALKDQLVKIGTETQSLLTKIDALTAIIQAGPVSPELQAAVEALKDQATVVDNLVPDLTPPPA